MKATDLLTQQHKDVAAYYGIEFKGVVFFPAGSDGGA